MAKGYYVLSSDGQFVASANNAITTNGYLMMNKYLANSAQEWAGAMAIGVLNTLTTASTTDTNMEYEIARYPINFRSFTTVSGSNQIVMKASIDSAISGSFTEIGIYPGLSVSRDNYLITDFSDSYAGSSTWTASGSTSTLNFVPYSRVSGSNVYMTGSNSYINNSGFYLDLSKYYPTDSVKVLMYAPSTTSVVMQVVFGDSVGNTWKSASATASGAAGTYYVVSPSLSYNYSSDFNYNVTSMSINFQTYSSTASVIFDAIKLVSGDNRLPENSLVSRTVFTTPITKAYGQPMQIEYYMQVT